MQNVKLLQKLFPKHEKLIPRLALVIGITSVIIGFIISFFVRD
jgi:hypothetical protein